MLPAARVRPVPMAAIAGPPRRVPWVRAVRTALLVQAGVLALSGPMLREEVHRLSEAREHGSVIELLTPILTGAELSGKPLDGLSPSLWEYYGVAWYGVQELERARVAFSRAVLDDPGAGGAWSHLGDVLLATWQVRDALTAYEEAIRRGAGGDPSKLYRARRWMADWQHDDLLAAMLLDRASAAARTGGEARIGPSDVHELSPDDARRVAEAAPHARASEGRTAALLDARGLTSRPLRVGFVSSDLGVHPVSSLVRPFLRQLNLPSHRATVYCFALREDTSWWRERIEEEVAVLIDLPRDRSPLEHADLIASHGIDVLIDLNGNTLHSGLPIFAHRPAPLQITWLGLPSTTGARFVDYVLSDWVAAAPSGPAGAGAAAFTERLLLLPPSYIVNDHAALQGHTVADGRLFRRPQGSPPAQSPCTTIESGTLPGAVGRVPALPDAFLFACFSNWQKMDRALFQVWTNVLRRVPHGRLWLQKYRLWEEASENLAREAAAMGVPPSSLIYVEQAPWVVHTQWKAAADLALDTVAKNGHTTGLDSLWAGLPLVTLPGAHAGQRAGASFAAATSGEDLDGSATGATVVHSLKAYEDVAARLAHDPALLAALRRGVELERLRAGGLFDSQAWTRRAELALKAAVEAGVARDRSGAGMQLPHVFSTRTSTPAAAPGPKAAVQLGSGLSGSGSVSCVAAPLLHVGGQQRREGWTIVDIEAREEVDIVAPMWDLSFAANGSVLAIYASHCLEHADHRGVVETLQEWRRVLRAGGALFVGVPDLGAIASLLLPSDPPRFSALERWQIQRILFGAQTSEHDVHRTGFDEATLGQLLADAGFCKVQRVPDFGLFEDATLGTYAGEPISLNLRASACESGSGPGDTLPGLHIALPALEPPRKVPVARTPTMSSR